MLKINNLHASINDTEILKGINLQVNPGEIHAIMGPNGSGKTTTIRMLLGLVRTTGGTGEILGESITHPEKYLPKVGAMIEGPAFYPALSGKENLNVLAALGGFSKERVQPLLEKVGLGDRGNSKFKTYSLGMKQRLGIAAALLPNPKLLVLDEPTNGLDPAGIQEVRELIRDLATDGTTVFVSSHLLSEIEMISEYLVMLREGKVIFYGKTAELLAQQQPVIVAKSKRATDLKKLLKIAKNSGHSASIIAGAVHVISDSSFAAEFNELAFDAGITLSSLNAVLPTLEETFFEMTGE